MDLEWDETKDRANQAMHGLSFAQASELFTSGVDFLEIYDDTYERGEERFIAIGPIETGVIVVVYTEVMEDRVRIISARAAERDEIRAFQQAMAGYSDD